MVVLCLLRGAMLGLGYDCEMAHPSSKFDAPNNIPAGSNLTALLGEHAIDLTWQCFRAAGSKVQKWDAAQLASNSADLGLMQHAAFIADALQQVLPVDQVLSLVSNRSHGTKLTACEDNSRSIFLPALE